MFTARRKIQKDNGVEPTEFEDTVAQVFFDLENGNQELKSDLKDLYINGAVQMDVAGNRKAVIIHVPYRLQKSYKKIHVRLVRELEKKFSGKDQPLSLGQPHQQHQYLMKMMMTREIYLKRMRKRMRDTCLLGKDVVLVATRRIMRPPKKGSAIVRPRSRTLTAVHDGILEDVVYPAEIVGKRIRYHMDGAKVLKVFLDPKERTSTENKLDTFSSVYRRLCGKEVVFDYPVAESA